MAYKLFIDTNVYLDFLMQRGTEWKEAEIILELAEKNIIEIFTSASCVLNLMYIMRSSKLSYTEIISHANNILSYSKLVNPDNTAFHTALSIGFLEAESTTVPFTCACKVNTLMAKHRLSTSFLINKLWYYEEFRVKIRLEIKITIHYL